MVPKITNQSAIGVTFYHAYLVYDAQNNFYMASNPVTLQLRYLQTLTEIASEKNSTVIFPLPIDLLKAFTDSAKKSGGILSER